MKILKLSTQNQYQMLLVDKLCGTIQKFMNFTYLTLCLKLLPKQYSEFQFKVNERNPTLHRSKMSRNSKGCH